LVALDDGLEQREKRLNDILLLLLQENILTTTAVTTLKVELKGKNSMPSNIVWRNRITCS
jgi:hypothetical protein